MKRSRSKVKYNKWKSREIYATYRQAKRECDKLTEAAKTLYCTLKMIDIVTSTTLEQH